MRRHTWRLLNLGIMIVVLGLGASSLAQAGLISRSNSGAQSFASAKWAAGAVATNAVNPNGSDYVISAVARSTSGATGSYFSIKNSGNITLNNVTIILTASGIPKSPATTLNIHECSGTWTESSGACSGTISLVYTRSSNVSNQSISYSASISAGSAKRLRVQYVKNGGTATISTTYQVQVNRSQIRAILTFNG